MIKGSYGPRSASEAWTPQGIRLVMRGGGQKRQIRYYGKKQPIRERGSFALNVGSYKTQAKHRYVGAATPKKRITQKKKSGVLPNKERLSQKEEKY